MSRFDSEFFLITSKIGLYRRREKKPNRIKNKIFRCYMLCQLLPLIILLSSAWLRFKSEVWITAISKCRMAKCVQCANRNTFSGFSLPFTFGQFKFLIAQITFIRLWLIIICASKNYKPYVWINISSPNTEHWTPKHKIKFNNETMCRHIFSFIVSWKRQHFTFRPLTYLIVFTIVIK